MAQILFNWLTPLRWIFLAIDSLLFGLIDGCYTIIISFANAELFTTEQIAELRTKIYFVITLIAFFRLAFLLVNSLINPDKLTDENEGLSKIAFNFVIMLVLLVVTPIIFNIALEFQKEVVNGNVITGIFSLSNSSGYSCNDTYTDKQLEIDRNDYKTEEDYLNEKEHKKAAKCSSDKMKGLVISSLIYPDSKIAHEEDGKYAINDDVTCTGSCKDAIEAYNTMTEDGYYDFLTLEKYIAATGEVNDSEVFAYNYTLIITTICAGFIVYILLSFAFDLGKRLLELNLLMILSPLFIATYVDPKSAKSGPFNNWLKAIGKSYVSLFLKLAALAVMLLFIKILSINKVGLKPIGPIGFIILLFAGLTFCKELPKWLGGLLGSEGGMGELGLGKKLGATPLLGGAAKKAGLLATGALAGAATNAAALGRQRRQIRSQARKDAGLGRVLNTEGRKAALDGQKGLNGYKNLRAARKTAYNKAFDAAGLKRGAAGAIGQGLSGLALGAKAGGTTGIKADNIKGAFKGSVQSSKQGLKGLGITGGETLGQKIMTGISSGTAALESQFGTPWEAKERRDAIEANEKALKIAGKNGPQAFAAKYKFDDKGEPIPLEAGAMAISGKQQAILQTNTAKKFESSNPGQLMENLSEKDNLSVGLAYAAATRMHGEAAINGISIKDGTVTVDMDPKVVSSGKLEFNSEKDPSFGGAFAAGGPETYREIFYSTQQKTVQSYQQYNEAAVNNSKALADLRTAIAAVPNQLRTALSDISVDLTSESTTELRKNIETAIKDPANSSEDRQKALKNALKALELREGQQTRESQLTAEGAAIEKKLGELTESIKAITGDSAQAKAVNVERAMSDTKGIAYKTEEDK